jgi:hypothetical protein
MIYKNINIANAQDREIDLCKQVIDIMQEINYEQYEVIVYMAIRLAHHDEQLVYRTCLHEDAGGDIPFEMPLKYAVNKDAAELWKMRQNAIRLKDFMGRILIDNKLSKLQLTY